MRRSPLPDSTYAKRAQRLQAEMVRENIDVFIGYSSESESATTRYLAGFWPFFDFAGVVVPVAGEPALVTGGPESYEFARKLSGIPQIVVNPLFVETSSPDWVPQVDEEDFSGIIPRVCGSTPRRVGIANWNIFPHVIMQDVRKALPDAELVPADDLLLRVQAIKDDEEIPYIREAYRITEAGMKAALDAAEAGKREWELEAIARSTMVLMGAEGTPYPPWVCSGPNTTMSLARSTNRPIERDELVQYTFGAKYMGYCGNMCRVFGIGSIPPGARKLLDVALEAMHYTLSAIRPGVHASEVYHGYHKLLSKYGYEEFTLYGPAHGTGTSEVEGLWLSESANFVIQPRMLFNIDIWLSDGTHGLRLEDGVLVTDDGLEELNSYRREAIIL